MFLSKVQYQKVMQFMVAGLIMVIVSLVGPNVAMAQKGGIPNNGGAAMQDPTERPNVSFNYYYHYNTRLPYSVATAWNGERTVNCGDCGIISAFFVGKQRRKFYRLSLAPGVKFLSATVNYAITAGYEGDSYSRTTWNGTGTLAHRTFVSRIDDTIKPKAITVSPMLPMRVRSIYVEAYTPNKPASPEYYSPKRRKMK